MTCRKLKNDIGIYLNRSYCYFKVVNGCKKIANTKKWRLLNIGDYYRTEFITQYIKIGGIVFSFFYLHKYIEVMEEHIQDIFLLGDNLDINIFFYYSSIKRGASLPE